MTEPDFRALCAELLEWADRASAHYYVKPDLLVRARAALSQPAPKLQTDEELYELWIGDIRRLSKLWSSGEIGDWLGGEADREEAG